MEDNLKSVEYKRRKAVKWNYWVSTIDGMFANVAVGMVTPFLAVYAMTLGGSNDAVGLITAVPALVNTIMFLPAAALVERHDSKLDVAVRAAFAQRIIYMAMALVPFMPAPKWHTAILIGLIGIQTVPANITAVAWNALMGETFPQEDRASLFAMRSMYCSLVALGSSMLAGILLDKMPYPANYVSLFTISFITSMLSTYYLSKMKEFPNPRVAPLGMSVRERLHRPFADPEYGARFKVFTISAVLVQLGINIAVPVYSIYYVRVLHLSNGVIGSLSLAAGLTAVLAYPMWGVVSRRAGNAVVFAISILAFAGFPVIYGLSGSAAYLIAMQLVIGMFNAGHAFTLFNLMLEYVNPKESANGIAVFSMLVNATGIIGPSIGTFFVSHWGVMGAFIVSTVVRSLGCVVFIKAIGFEQTFGRLHAAFGPAALKKRRHSQRVKGVL